MSIDFTNCPMNKLLWYGGANGKKIGINLIMKAIC